MLPVRRLTFVVAAVVALLVPAGAARAQRLSADQWAESVRSSIDAATRAGGVRRLVESRGLVARAVAAHPDDALLRHYEGFVLYRLVTVGAGELSPAATAAFLHDARVALEASIARRPMAESWLLLSEVYGRQIAADPSRAATLGPAMALARARAMSAGATNPRVYLLAGIAAIYADPAAGGGLDAAEQLLQAAVDLFERDRVTPPAPAWGRAEAFAWLGQVYQRTDRAPAAAALYARALALEPDNAWVRDVLVPSVR